MCSQLLALPALPMPFCQHSCNLPLPVQLLFCTAIAYPSLSQKRTCHPPPPPTPSYRLPPQAILYPCSPHYNGRIIIIYICMYNACRSKDFRPSYSRLAEICSLIPAGTPCMLCTALEGLTIKGSSPGGVNGPSERPRRG